MDALFLFCDIEEIVTGNEPGADQLALRYATEKKKFLYVFTKTAKMKGF